jgi:NTP pyrophosphatase (non-canonical NTP hydrolase)
MRFVATAADIVVFKQCVFKQCVRQWGLRRQILKTIEEMLGLKVELFKVMDNGLLDLDKVADEIADVYIMLHQAAYGLNINEAVDKRVEYKMERLVKNLALKGGDKDGYGSREG